MSTQRSAGRRLTMKQIGDIVGVSQSTVSRVLSGAPSPVPVALDTRERILKLVADLGYMPNPMARALRSARTGLIGLIVRDINDPFFSAAIAVFTAEAQAHGYSVVLGHVQSSARKAIALREVLAMGHCEGAILLGDLRDQGALWVESPTRVIPLVGLWQGSRAPNIPVVNVDNRQGIRLAVEHAYALGHRRIAFLQGGRTGDGLERREAFVSCARELHLTVPEGYLEVAVNDYAATSVGATQLLGQRQRPTAVIASTDVAAVGALKAAASAGIRVPEQLSIVGFDDIPLAAFTVPSLTTLHQPLRQLSRLAIKQLLELVDQPERRPEVTLIAPSLIVRGSTAAPLS
jgi:DNA-binding LacI/PurR family transcriptional regulator